MIRFDDVIKHCRKKLPMEFKAAFIAAVCAGLVAHMYMFTNKLPNFDDLGAINGFGVTFKNGRWFLWILGAAAYHLNLVFSLPWFNGLFTLTVLGISAGMIAMLLQIKSAAANVLLGAALVVFPSWTSTFFYMFTTPYYAAAVLMSVVSVYLTAKCSKGFLGAIPLLACAIGIYQAYIPFTATLFVILLFLGLYDDGTGYAQIVRRSFFYLFTLGASVLLYFICMKVSLALTGQSLNTYKGIDSMGKLNLMDLPERIGISFFGVFFNNDLEISYNLITKGMYFVLFAGSVISISGLFLYLLRKKEYLKGIEVLVLTAAYVLAINSIYLICNEGIYSLMYYSYVFLMIFPLALIDRSAGILRDSVVIAGEYVMNFVLIVGIVSYCHFANGQYLSIDLSLKQAVSYCSTLVTQIKNTEGYREDLNILLYGDQIGDRTLYHNEIMNVFSMTGRDDALVDAYSRLEFLKFYCGFDAPFVGTDDLPPETTLMIRNMPCYPTDGSIRIINDTVVVKFSEKME